MKRLFTFLLLALSMMLFTACGTKEVTYEEGLMDESVNGFEQMMFEYFTSSCQMRQEKEEDTYICAKLNVSDQQNEIIYTEVSKADLQAYNDRIFKAENPDQEISELFKQSEDLGKEIQDKELPSIQKNGVTLHIALHEHTQTLPLDDLHQDIHRQDKIIMNLLHNNAHGFVLAIENFTNGKYYYLFSDATLSENLLIEEGNLAEMVEAGDMVAFYEVLAAIGEENQYRLLPNSSILDIETNVVHHLGREDQLSNDYAYVYIDGRLDDSVSIKDGVQQIQTIDNYIEGNEEYEADFRMNYKRIAQKMGIKTSGASTSTINYFAKDFVMIHVNYKGQIVGSSDATNILINLEENIEEPTAYLVDLSILSQID